MTEADDKRMMSAFDGALNALRRRLARKNDDAREGTRRTKLLDWRDRPGPLAGLELGTQVTKLLDAGGAALPDASHGGAGRTGLAASDEVSHTALLKLLQPSNSLS